MLFRSSEVHILDGHFRRFGSFYEDIFLYDLAGSLAEHSGSYFNKEAFGGLPSGISIDHLRNVHLTPARIILGNVRNGDLQDIILRIQTCEVQQTYEKWLRNEWAGVHQARVVPQAFGDGFRGCGSEDSECAARA